MFEWLRNIPRPSLPPFFAARVAAKATAKRGKTPAILYLYWAAFIFFAAPVLARYWWGVAIIALVAAMATASRLTSPARTRLHDRRA